MPVDRIRSEPANLVTEDDEVHTVPASPASVSAVVALSQADTVLAWDPTNRTLIAAIVVGTMPWTPPTTQPAIEDFRGHRGGVTATPRCPTRSRRSPAAGHLQLIPPPPGGDGHCGCTRWWVLVEAEGNGASVASLSGRD